MVLIIERFPSQFENLFLPALSSPFLSLFFFRFFYMSLFSRSRRPFESSAVPKPSKTSRKTEPSNAQFVSEAETIKYHSSLPHHAPSATAGVNASHHAQPVLVPEIATFRKQTNHSSNFNVVRSSTISYPTQAPRSAVTTIPQVYPSSVLHQQQQNNQHQMYQQQYYKSQLAPGTSSSKPAAAPVSHPQRVSGSDAYSINTMSSTSRSSVDQASILQHSWDSNTLSTAPSSTAPKSTDSLVRIQAASDPRDWDGPLSPLDRSMGASRGFPLVESDGQSRSTIQGGYTAGEQASNALPLPNSEYESPARVRSLRRTKAHITSPNFPGTDSTLSHRVATSTAGRASPTPVQRPPSPPKPQEHRRTRSEIPPTTEMAHRIHSQDHGGGRASLLSRVMSTSTPRHSHSSSTASTRTNMHQPRVASTAQSAHTNMTKLKQTTVPRIPYNNDANASPMVDTRDRQFASLHSPRQASLDSTHSSWSSARSPTMTSSVPAHPNLASAVMSPRLSTIASPRTLVSGSHHSADIPPILPSQLYHSTGSTIGKRGSVFIEEDRDSGASTVTATPSSPASHVVRTLFSSLTSRPHRHSTPQPLRGSALSNPPITAQEVASPRLVAAAAGILPPPPIPPQSTRPDAPQQGYVQDAHQYSHPTSPRHSTADFTKSAHSKLAAESRLANMRSPSSTQSSTLRSYGLDGNAANPGTPISGSHRVPLGTPYHVPSRTLMSDSEVTTVTTVSVTRSTVVSQATATHPVERRGSNAQRRSSTNSTRGATQQQQLQYAQQQPQSPQQPQQQQPGGLFNMFRPKSPKIFPSIERTNSPAPPLPPVPSKTPPPRAATASPRRFAFSLPLNFRHKPKKSISGASVEAVIGGAFGMAGESAMSSRGSLRRSATPELPYSEYPGSTVNGGRYNAAKQQRRNRHGDEDIGDEGDDYQDYADRDGDDAADVDDGLMEDRMRAVQDWNQTTEQNWQQSGKRRARPGVSFDIPASESERDDSGLTAVSVAQGTGRVLRLRQYQETRQFSDAESFVY